MNQTEHIYKIGNLLGAHRYVSSLQLQEALEVSRATLNRDIAYMRDRLCVPIFYEKTQGGYFLDRSQRSQAELLGLWFFLHRNSCAAHYAAPARNPLLRRPRIDHGHPQARRRSRGHRAGAIARAGEDGDRPSGLAI
jgi:hypothetical protein